MLEQIRFSAVLAIGLMVLTLAGCDSMFVSKTKVVPVSGRITLDDEPLAHAKVLFVPVVEKNQDNLLNVVSYGVTDEMGGFILQLDAGGDGAVIGKHIVFITTRQEEAGSKVDSAGKEFQLAQCDEKVPARYNRDTQLTYHVCECGNARADFELRSKVD